MENNEPLGMENNEPLGEENNEPLGKALTELQKEGYREDLNFLETDSFSLYGGDLDMRLNPDCYHVDAIDRIGEDSQPEGEVVYAISTVNGVKGILVDKPDTESC